MNTQNAGIPSGRGPHRALVGLTWDCQTCVFTNAPTAVRADSEQHSQQRAHGHGDSSHSSIQAFVCLPQSPDSPSQPGSVFDSCENNSWEGAGLGGLLWQPPLAPGYSAALISSRALSGAAIKVNVWHHTAGSATARRLQGDSDADTEPVPSTKANSSSSVAKATGCW